MSDEYANSLQMYWKWIDGLSEDVKQVVLTHWDETGRPISEPQQPVVDLLNRSNTWDEFSSKYFEMISGFDNTAEPSFEESEKAIMYWALYVAGLKRALPQ